MNRYSIKLSPLGVIKMIISVSRRKVFERGGIFLKLLVIFFIIVFILPFILNLIWDGFSGSKIRDERLPEKPLRVISLSLIDA